MVDGIILASGFSTRMERNKLLLPVNSSTVIEEVLSSAMKSELKNLILIYREKKVEEIGKKLGVRLVANNRAELGQAESVKLGVAASNADGYLFIAADQPFITPEFIDMLIECFIRTGKGIIAPVFEGRIKMPILFSNRYRQSLLKIEGEHGGFEIIEGNACDVELVEVMDKKLVADIDTMDDYQWIISNV